MMLTLLLLCVVLCYCLLMWVFKRNFLHFLISVLRYCWLLCSRLYFLSFFATLLTLKIFFWEASKFSNVSRILWLLFYLSHLSSEVIEKFCISWREVFRVWWDVILIFRGLRFLHIMLRLKMIRYLIGELFRVLIMRSYCRDKFLKGRSLANLFFFSLN